MEKVIKVIKIIVPIVIVVLFLVGGFFLADAVWGFYAIGGGKVDNAACWVTAAILFASALLILILEGIFLTDKDKK